MPSSERGHLSVEVSKWTLCHFSNKGQEARKVHLSHEVRRGHLSNRGQEEDTLIMTTVTIITNSKTLLKIHTF